MTHLRNYSNENYTSSNVSALQPLKDVYNTALTGKELYEWYRLQADVFYQLILNLTPLVRPKEFALAVAQTCDEVKKERITNAFRWSARAWMKAVELRQSAKEIPNAS